MFYNNGYKVINYNKCYNVSKKEEVQILPFSLPDRNYLYSRNDLFNKYAYN